MGAKHFIIAVKTSAVKLPSLSYVRNCWVWWSVMVQKTFKSIIVNHSLWFTAHCLRHSVFAESYFILEGGRENKISQSSLNIQQMFLILLFTSESQNPNTCFLSVSPPEWPTEALTPDSSPVCF